MMPENETQDLIKYHVWVYEHISKSYHNARFSDMRGRYDLFETWKLTTEIYEELNLDLKTVKALDVGCGTGKLSLPLASAGADVNCLDAAMGMLKECRRNAVEEKVGKKIHLTAASAFMLPYRSNCYDLVVASRFLHLFPHSYYPKLIGEMLRVVAPGGYLVIEIKNKNYGFILNRWNEYKRKRKNRVGSSMMNLWDIPGLQKELAGGQIIQLKSCQVPKGHLFAFHSKAAVALRALSRTLLRPIAGFYYVVIQKASA